MDGAGGNRLALLLVASEALLGGEEARTSVAADGGDKQYRPATRPTLPSSNSEAYLGARKEERASLQKEKCSREKPQQARDQYCH